MKRHLLFLMAIGFSAMAVTEKVAATYTVPVPFELAKYAAFPLPNSTLTYQAGDLELQYYLPLEIVHSAINETPILLKGKAKKFPEFFEMKQVGSTHTAQCLLRKDGVTCFVSYDFTTQVEEVLTYIKMKYPLEEVNGRGLVVQAFGAEAHGLVFFPLSHPLE